MGKLIYGVGVYEKGEFKSGSMVGGKWVITKEYNLWRDMLKRCYSEECHQKYPTYSGCSVSEDFKYFQRFAKWCQSQIGFGEHSYQLDKDILYRGNKVYSEDVCVFVHSNINSLLTKHDAARGGCPIGVHWYRRDQNYMAQCCIGGVRKNLGYFSTPEAAHNAYKVFKEAAIKRLANEYQPFIDPRVYSALVNYTVSITD